VPDEPNHANGNGMDRELDLKAIVFTGIGLALLLIGAAALMWPLSTGLRSFAARIDQPTPALPEAATQPLPPEPRLQTDPARELAEMRREEELRLSTYEWVSESTGVARIPIDRAIELLVEHGEPETTTPPAEPTGEANP
jgi:hypothetical protein